MSNKPIIFFVCTGLGRIKRGYESFTRECFEAIKCNSEFTIFLLKGAGENKDKELKVRNIHRNGKLAYLISKFSSLDSYTIEQFTFFLNLTFKIVKYKPSVIYYSDFELGTYLWHFNKWIKFKFKLLFSNGAPNSPPFTRMHHVQQLLPKYYYDAILADVPSSFQTLLPYGINIDVKKNLKKIEEKEKIKQRLKIPEKKKILITVGAINASHKRMDYVIEEFKKIENKEEYYLILLGQTTNETPVIFEIASSLPEKLYSIKEVDVSEVGNFLAIADYFILASLNEGLPRVLPEALSYGLLPIVHDYEISKQVLDKFGVFVNMRETGILSSAINQVSVSVFNKTEIINFAFGRYSWDVLTDKYINMLHNLAK